MKAIPLSKYSSPKWILVQREDWASPEPVYCLFCWTRSGPGLPVVVGTLIVHTEVFRLHPSPLRPCSVLLGVPMRARLFLIQWYLLREVICKALVFPRSFCQHPCPRPFFLRLTRGHRTLGDGFAQKLSIFTISSFWFKTLGAFSSRFSFESIEKNKYMTGLSVAVPQLQSFKSQHFNLLISVNYY